MNKIRGFEKISTIHQDIIMPRRATKKSAGYDIFNNTGYDILIKAKSISDIYPTYIKSYMLDDEVLKMYIRSSLAFKYHINIINAVGVLDSDYYNNETNEGHIFIKFLNHSDQDLIISSGSAMAQCIFTKYYLADGDSFDIGNTRISGIGSTN